MHVSWEETHFLEIMFGRTVFMIEPSMHALMIRLCYQTNRAMSVCDFRKYVHVRLCQHDSFQRVKNNAIEQN